MTTNVGGALPEARSENLVVQELQDETLVYDLDNHKAHCLNRSASLVWKACDGHTPVDQIARGVTNDMGETVGEDAVWTAITQLEKAKLLSAPVAAASGKRISRRALVRGAAVAAAVATIPVVTTILAPTAYAAASCVLPGDPCDALRPCCSGDPCDAFGFCP